ncbi:unnamed protein product (macronuclear) [Paramecium tetraurelia]|uniref:Uncharacterized protein n=1 Tax=Paramecium tetraurelia TaxID=5888 RepID=A0EHK6_PARTE|nr:uncharacterized protein GSPATT00027121001 [Paramecium tetraurelia]CAK94797.1 unnamed protein product [Paramecium tetraurelia]|eukprot:XP_001462170.1 hypothetical protein (macronuclear) [Paramecium tetraurelia strain d4-2]
MNRKFENLNVQTKFDFDAIISQLDNGSPLAQIYTKKFSGIKNLDLYETPDDQYETPKDSCNSLIEDLITTKQSKKEL